MTEMQKLGKIEAVGLSLAVIINNIIFNMTSIIFNYCGSGSWINIIYVSILSLIFTFIIILLLKPFPSLDLLDISSFLGGKALRRLGFSFICNPFYVFFCYLCKILC